MSAPAPETRPRSLFARVFSLDLLDNRYAPLHGLRVLAIVSVVQYHVTAILAVEEKLPLDKDFVSSSLAVFFGMDLFFLLSGFLIGSILLRAFEVPLPGSTTPRPNRGVGMIRRFYLRRAFRTFPSYWVVLTVLASVTALTPMQRHNLPYEYAYLTNFFLLTRTGVVMLWGWSLALEEQFYLVVPFLFLILNRLRSDRARVLLLVALFFAALATRVIIYLSHHGPWGDLEIYGALYFRTHTRYDTLIAGILLALVHNRWQGAIGRWLTHPFNRALLLLPSLGCFWFLARPWMFGEKYLQLVHLFMWGTITSIMYFAWLLILLQGDGWIHRALSLPFFRRVATVGYGVYLVHIPVCDRFIVPFSRALMARHVSAPLVWVASLVALLVASHAIAYVIHIVIEKPSLWLRDRFAG